MDEYAQAPTDADVPTDVTAVRRYRSKKLTIRLALRKSLPASRAALPAPGAVANGPRPPGAASLPAESARVTFAAMPDPPVEPGEASIFSRLLLENLPDPGTRAVSPDVPDPPAEAGSAADREPMCRADEPPPEGPEQAFDAGPLPPSMALPHPPQAAPPAAAPESAASPRPEAAGAAIPPPAGQNTAEAAADRTDPPGDPAPAAPVAAPDTSLATLGFGPGMVARLDRLGIRNVADVADADAGALREALGEISRLIDVATWIARARASLARG